MGWGYNFNNHSGKAASVSLSLHKGPSNVLKYGWALESTWETKAPSTRPHCRISQSRNTRELVFPTNRLLDTPSLLSLFCDFIQPGIDLFPSATVGMFNACQTPPTTHSIREACWFPDCFLSLGPQPNKPNSDHGTPGVFLCNQTLGSLL